MELSEHRHILYFSEQPIILMEELLKIKNIGFTHIPTGIPETALSQAQQHYIALKASPFVENSGIGFFFAVWQSFSALRFFSSAEMTCHIFLCPQG